VIGIVSCLPSIVHEYNDVQRDYDVNKMNVSSYWW